MDKEDLVLGLRQDYEKQLIKQYKTALTSIRAEMLKTSEKYSKGFNLTKSEAFRYARDKGMIDNINREITNLGGNVLKIEKELQSEIFKKGYYYSTYEIDKQTGFNFTMDSPSFSIIPTFAITELTQDETFLKSVDNLSFKTKQLIKSTITQGAIRGQSIPEITKAIKELLGTATNSALLIARTETHKAMERGSLESYRYAEKNGVKLSKKWTATKDGRTRTSHRYMDGQIASNEVDGEMYFKFSKGGLTLGPGLSGIAAEDISCRCSTTAVVEGYEPTQMRVGKEIVDYKSYTEWESAKIAA